MPIFEYRCSECGRRFEELVLSDSKKIVCPDCGSEDVEKEFSLFSSSGHGCAPSGGGFG
jgi:putative FmdB family regulatory protein